MQQPSKPDVDALDGSKLPMPVKYEDLQREAFSECIHKQGILSNAVELMK